MPGESGLGLVRSQVCPPTFIVRFFQRLISLDPSSRFQKRLNDEADVDDDYEAEPANYSEELNIEAYTAAKEAVLTAERTLAPDGSAFRRGLSHCSDRFARTRRARDGSGII